MTGPELGGTRKQKKQLLRLKYRAGCFVMFPLVIQADDEAYDGGCDKKDTADAHQCQI